MLFNKEQVLAFLPHRNPFLFIDTVESIEAIDDRAGTEIGLIKELKDLVGLKVNANFYTREDHPIFEGHFPGNPILPGVVQVEMMGQAACFAIAKMYEDVSNLTLGVALMGVSNAKFRKPVTPAMNLEVKAICTRARGPIMSYDCQLFNDGELVSEASVLATVKI